MSVIKCSIYLVFVLGVFFSSASAFSMTPSKARENVEKTLSAEQLKDNKKGEREFAGLNFGVGLSITFDTGDNSRVKSASIVDGIVRVDNEDDKIARIMLESHYFFKPEKTLFGVAPGNWGWGPYVAIQPGTDEIIEAIGVGLMVGFRKPGDDKGESWNVGLGYVTDPNVDILGDGFIENQAAPGNETAVRLKEISQDGIMMLFSFSF